MLSQSQFKAAKSQTSMPPTESLPSRPGNTAESYQAPIPNNNINQDVIVSDINTEAHPFCARVCSRHHGSLGNSGQKYHNTR